MQVDELASLAGVIIAAATLVVTLTILRYQREDRKPVVEPWKQYDGTKWQIGVRCLRGPVLKCGVELGGVALQPEAEGAPPGIRLPYKALAQGAVAIWRVPQKVGDITVSAESDLMVSIKNDNQVLRRDSFKDIRRSGAIISVVD